MAKHKVYVTRIIPDEALKKLNESLDVTVWNGELPPPREVLLESVRQVDGIISNVTDNIDAEVMNEATKLKVVSNFAVGFDNIDINEATRRGIIVTNTPGVLTETTADLAFALLMAAARRVVEGDKYVRSGKWKTWGPKTLLGRDVFGATIGIIGFGRIGQAVARRAKGFEMKILYYDIVKQQTSIEDELSAKFCSLSGLLAESDFVTIHTNLTPETHHLIGREELKRMKGSSILVNTARGPIVDHFALYEALKSGTIAGAALDVTEPEPLPIDHPLLTLENVIVTPHIGSASVATRNRMALMAVENLLLALKGETPPNIVNPLVLKPV